MYKLIHLSKTIKLHYLVTDKYYKEFLSLIRNLDVEFNVCSVTVSTLRNAVVEKFGNWYPYLGNLCMRV